MKIFCAFSFKYPFFYIQDSSFIVFVVVVPSCLSIMLIFVTEGCNSECSVSSLFKDNMICFSLVESA